MLDTAARKPGLSTMASLRMSFSIGSLLLKVGSGCRVSAGADAARISVEVSERGLDANLAGLEALAEVLARHGTHLGIEHFGRQLAALPRLYALQLAYLKLDGSFVASLHEDVGLQRLVKAIVDVARGLDVVVYAEQVHTADEWAAAAHLGVSGMTGPEASRRLAAS